MAFKIYLISIHSANLAALVLAIFSVIYCWRRYNARYLRSFPLYAIVNVCVDFLGLLAPGWGVLTENVFTVFETLFFAFFLGRLSHRKNSRRFLNISAAVFAGLYLITVSKKSFIDFTGWFVIGESFILCSGCLLFYRELMLQPQVMDLTRYPAFWMVAATLFYFALEIPTYFICSYFAFKGDRELSFATYSINNFAQVINSVLFIKGMTCLKEKSS
jgi:hypothetical protein